VSGLETEMPKVKPSSGGLKKSRTQLLPNNIDIASAGEVKLDGPQKWTHTEYFTEVYEEEPETPLPPPPLPSPMNSDFEEEDDGDEDIAWGL
jgi:hypothetical protein